MNYKEILKQLKAQANPKNVEGMARFGINPKNTLGVSMPKIRALAKKIGKDHTIAKKLWASKVHEARILSALVDEPDKVTRKQMDSWIKGFDSWDVCDQACMNLFDKTPFAYDKAVEWTSRKREFEKRAGYALMASLALHDKAALDKKFEAFFPAIIKGSVDERNFVKKAVNWALRQIGKRNQRLKNKAIVVSKQILKLDSKSAKWVARDAIRELSLR